MSLNYNFLETIKLYDLALKNNMFIASILSVIILNIVFIFNKKIIKYIALIINILLVFLILYYYVSGIISFKFSNPINNIYFYFLNSILFLIISVFIFFKTNYKKTNIIFYSISLINIVYSLFMTCYLKNITLIVIGNIFPMIKFGNIIYIIYYLLIVIFIIKNYVFDKKNIK